jgi:hypothetical protein
MSNRVRWIGAVICAALFCMAAANAAQAQDDFTFSPAQHVNIAGLQEQGEIPTLFGPVLRVTDGGGFERMQIDGTGSVVFRHAATIQFADVTTHAGKIRGFAYIRLPDGEQALIPVFALPGDDRQFGVSIDR